jgi:hypothetical protein
LQRRRGACFRKRRDGAVQILSPIRQHHKSIDSLLLGAAYYWRMEKEPEGKNEKLPKSDSPQPGPPPGPIREPWWKLVLSAGGWVLGMLVLLLVAYDQFKPKPPPRESKVDVKQRFQKGPYIAQSKPLSPSEELSLVIVPSPIDDYFDTKCLIYKNREFNQVVFTCPESTQQLWIEEPSDR